MPWYYIPLYILIIVIILGVLVSIHEAGHLLAAKIFNVYCFEYSIGFGPAFLHKKRKGGETYFSLRAFPLGGYVSMYGEPGEMPEGMEEPGPNRSLAEIAKWKKGIILLAGVTMNFVLGLVLIYVKDVAFPSYYFAYGGAIKSVTAEGTSKAMEVDALPAAYTGEILSYIDSQKEAELNANDYWIALPQYAYSDTAVYYIVDDDVEVFKADGTAYFSSAIHYVAAYYPSTLTEDHSLSGSIKLFPQTEKLAPVELQGVGIKHLPDVELDALGHDKALEITEPGVYFDVDLKLMPRLTINGEGRDAMYEDNYHNRSFVAKERVTLKENGFEGETTVKRLVEYPTWSSSWQNWARDVPTACGAIVKGFIAIFSPGGFSNLSGIIGMTAALPQMNALGGVGYIFYFAGLLSINLAFFNLLPFPGLDGWQLLVTVIEGVSKKKVPAKAQSIMNIIGMVLLFGLIIAITIKDILALFL